MLATLCMLITDEALGQRFSATIYYFMSVTNGTTTLTGLDQLAAFLADASAMLSMFAKRWSIVNASISLFFFFLGCSFPLLRAIV